MHSKKILTSNLSIIYGFGLRRKRTECNQAQNLGSNFNLFCLKNDLHCFKGQWVSEIVLLYL